MRTCPVCSEEETLYFKGRILRKYDINYYRCKNCGFLQTEEPFWLEEAYKQPINIYDTGIIQRNLKLACKTSKIITSEYDKHGTFLDYAGGYGLFTRIMRDKGFDFLWYDPYTQNLFAQGFQYDKTKHTKIELITAYEVFEHFINPIVEIDKILSISRNIIISTELLPESTPNLENWWYYCPEHGQHVSFYTKKSCELIAQRFKLNFYSVSGLHIFSEKKLNINRIKFIFKVQELMDVVFNKQKMRSKTWEDYLWLRKLNNE